MLAYHKTPSQEIQSQILADAGVRLIVKREDLNHPFVSGNKWWKLKYNIEEVQRSGKDTILTFGGAFSNHIYATSAACDELWIKSIGLIRGEETFPINPTIEFAKEKGMEIHYISREDYRKKSESQFIDELHNLYGDFYLIPEGGTNEFAIQGCAEFVQSFADIDYDYLCLPVGTGGTIAGIIKGLKGEKTIIGVSVLKGDFLQDEVTQLVQPQKNPTAIYGNWSILTSYHHGGYARVTPELVEFMREMREEHNLPLDPVYTGKLLWAVIEEVRRGCFRKGSTILALHTGGLQGGIMM